MCLRNVVVVYTSPETRQEKKTRMTVSKILLEEGIPLKVIERKKLKSLKGKDLVIPVGGDGTFLATAQQVNGTPLLGVNADTKHKEGFLLSSTERSFRKDLKKILKHQYTIKELPLLKARVNNKPVPVKAVNEFYVGAEKAYVTSRYRITIKKKTEVHRSSGLIVCTPQGVNAWANSVYGKKLIVPKNKYAYVIREPYENKVFSNYSLKKGILSGKDRVIFTSEMSSNVLVPDSLNKIKLKRHDKVVITKSRKTVKVVCV